MDLRHVPPVRDRRVAWPHGRDAISPCLLSRLRYPVRTSRPICTRYAARRARQRAIPPFAERLLDEFGERIYDGHGGVRVILTGKSIRQMERCFGHRPVAKLSEYFDVYKVEDSRSGATITLGHRFERVRR